MQFIGDMEKFCDPMKANACSLPDADLASLGEIDLVRFSVMEIGDHVVGRAVWRVSQTKRKQACARSRSGGSTVGFVFAGKEPSPSPIPRAAGLARRGD